MCELHEYEVLNKCIGTLKATSYDSSNKEYMVDIEDKVCNFDKAVKRYCGEHKLSMMPESCDALSSNSDKTILVEFKNKLIDPKDVYRIKNKVYDSVFICADVFGKDTNWIKDHVAFVLVYNEEKNKNNSNKSISKIKSALAKMSKKEDIYFGLSFFEKYMLNEVHTYTEKEFVEFWQST